MVGNNQHGQKKFTLNKISRLQAGLEVIRQAVLTEALTTAECTIDIGDVVPAVHDVGQNLEPIVAECAVALKLAGPHRWLASHKEAASTAFQAAVEARKMLSKIPGMILDKFAPDQWGPVVAKLVTICNTVERLYDALEAFPDLREPEPWHRQPIGLSTC
jgi:hypothetical protein